MISHVLRLAVRIPPTLFLALSAVFVLVRMIPGDSVTVLLDNSNSTPEEAEALREELGLREPLYVQYGLFMRSAVTGDLGDSLWSDEPVLPEILKERMPITVELAAWASLLALLFGVPAGVIAAIYQESWLDYGIRTIAIGALAIPGMWLATLVLVLPSYWWRWAPPFGYETLLENAGVHLQQMLIPASIMAIFSAAAVMRLVRSSMLDVLRQDYIRTARAKGLHSRTVILRHALRNALLPAVSVFGVQLIALLGGTVIYESIFTLPGVGTYMYESMSRRDYPAVQAVAVVLTVSVVLVNAIIDISYTMLDPRLGTSRL